jgi:hypothetical protein
VATDALQVRLESSDFSCASLQISRVTGREAISSPFSFVIELVCTEPHEIQPDELLQSRIQTHSGVSIIMKDR